LTEVNARLTQVVNMRLTARGFREEDEDMAKKSKKSKKGKQK